MVQVTTKKMTKAKQREEKLRTGLKALGAGKHKIAETLLAKKCRGVPGDAHDCPVAKYVQKLFPKAESVEIDCDDVIVQFSDGTVLNQKPPKAVCAFVTEFDGGETYPDLCE